MQRSVQAMDECYPGLTIRIGAQQYLERFYSGFGFVTASPTYIEDGIPHVEMVRRGRTQGSAEVGSFR
jgi:ElaA protein